MGLRMVSVLCKGPRTLKEFRGFSHHRGQRQWVFREDLEPLQCSPAPIPERPGGTLCPCGWSCGACTEFTEWPVSLGRPSRASRFAAIAVGSRGPPNRPRPSSTPRPALLLPCEVSLNLYQTSLCHKPGMERRMFRCGYERKGQRCPQSTWQGPAGAAASLPPAVLSCWQLLHVGAISYLPHKINQQLKTRLCKTDWSRRRFTSTEQLQRWKSG